ncbi:hypothetical protein [Streptomyces californicus]|uniref:hypothetical protein n=1 Tax=Streptomyces californicus TaxID=67351 RepID=UPI003792E2AE
MTQKLRRSSRAVQAREVAREKAARFRELEDERLRIAESAILIQEEIDDFDEETERRVAKLREERNSQLTEKRQRLDALVVEMIDTEIPAQEVSERLGMSVSQVRAAKKSFEQTVAAVADQLDDVHAGGSPAVALPPDDAAVTPVGVGVPGSTSVVAPKSYDFPPPGREAMVPTQDGSPESLKGPVPASGATD